MFTAADVAGRLKMAGVLPEGGPGPQALAQIDDMAEKVMNYLNSNGIPEGLFRTFCRLCGAYIKGGQAGAASGSGEVKSITEGSTTVTFNTSSESVRTGADEFIAEYAADLNRYRSVFPRKEEIPWEFQRM